MQPLWRYLPRLEACRKWQAILRLTGAHAAVDARVGGAPERPLVYRATFMGDAMSLNDMIAYWITICALAYAAFMPNRPEVTSRGWNAAKAAMR